MTSTPWIYDILKIFARRQIISLAVSKGIDWEGHVKQMEATSEVGIAQAHMDGLQLVVRILCITAAADASHLWPSAAFFKAADVSAMASVDIGLHKPGHELSVMCSRTLMQPIRQESFCAPKKLSIVVVWLLRDLLSCWEFPSQTNLGWAHQKPVILNVFWNPNDKKTTGAGSS